MREVDRTQKARGDEVKARERDKNSTRGGIHLMEPNERNPTLWRSQRGKFPFGVKWCIFAEFCIFWQAGIFFARGSFWSLIVSMVARYIYRAKTVRYCLPYTCVCMRVPCVSSMCHCNAVCLYAHASMLCACVCVGMRVFDFQCSAQILCRPK